MERPAREQHHWSWRAIGCFLVLVVLFNAPFDGVAIHAGRSEMAGGLLVSAAMWAPGAAAIATCLLFRKPLAALGLAWPRAGYAWGGYVAPLLYASLAYAALWITGLAPGKFAAFQQAAAQDLGFSWGAGAYTAALIVTVGVIRACANALGEEIGWRGFLTPALAERLPFAGVVLVSGAIWAAWHIPAILWEGYTSAAPPAVTIPCFTIGIAAAGGIAAWLRLRSGSVWPAVILHGTHNAVIQRLFDALTDQTGKAAYFATEFGIGIAVTSTLVLAGLLLWRGAPGRDR